MLDHALSLLKGAPDTELFYMQHSLAVMQSYIVSMISLSDTTTQIQKLLATISRKQVHYSPRDGTLQKSATFASELA